MAYSQEIIGAAKSLYLKRWTPIEIQTELGLPNARIIYYWADKHSWSDLLNTESVEEAISRRIVQLTERDKKNQAELDELDRLIVHHVKLLNRKEKVGAMPVQAKSQSTGGGQKKGKNNQAKNDVSHLTTDDFAPFVDTLFDYQKTLRDNKHQRTRDLLKSRQIGATYYFAWEAWEDAVLTGDNQMFLSASRAQSEIFRSYIVAMAQEHHDIELKGNPITLSNGAELRFLSTNSNTAQGHHGHVYIDEYFWIPGFTKLNKLASAMATHKKWRKTYFSTPSAASHPAYPFWTGEQWKKGSAKREHIEFPTFDEYRDGGRLCPDGQWRFVVTIEDAVKGGCNLFDIAQLRNEYNEADFKNLFLCIFIDDSQSIFKLSDLEKCLADAAGWTDFKPDSPEPFGKREVWLGYDPSRTRDNATCIVLAPASGPKSKHRVLEKLSWRGFNFQYQADQIEQLTRKYNVRHIGIDTTGIGLGVFELVERFFPRAESIHYSIDSKAALVLKALDVVQHKRLLWDAEHKSITASFLAIKHTTTNGGKLTYQASRTVETGHADDFFAICHALKNESLAVTERKSTWSI